MLQRLFVSEEQLYKNDTDYIRIMMINVVLMLANIVYIGFTAINYYRENYLMAGLDFLFAIPALYGYIDFRRRKVIKRAGTFAILLMFFSMLIVLFMFRAAEYTILWTFLFSFIAMMLKGERIGLRYIVVFYAITYVAAYQWIGETILLSEYIRFVAVSLVVAGIAFFYERSIGGAFARLSRANRQLVDMNENLERNVREGIEELRMKDELMVQTAKKAVMGEMIGAISHQWKQPLNVLGLIVQDLKEANKFGELTREYVEQSVERSMKQIHFMARTINDFKEFLQPEKNKEEFYLHECVEGVLDIVEKQLEQHAITVNFDYETIKTVNYRGELEQVLLNLVNNARDELVKKKQSDEAFVPRIDIRVAREEKNDLIAVADNGDGIPSECLTKIFESHFTTKGEDNGTGVGLYISRMIVENSLMGRLEVANQNGGGAQFQVIFPSV